MVITDSVFLLDASRKATRLDCVFVVLRGKQLVVLPVEYYANVICISRDLIELGKNNYIKSAGIME